MLPASSRDGSWTPLLDCLFTATSATCVTGLVIYDTYTVKARIAECRNRGKDRKKDALRTVLRHQRDHQQECAGPLRSERAAHHQPEQRTYGEFLNPLIMGTVSALIIAGGLGFVVYYDLFQYRRTRTLLLHTRVVLAATGILLLSGMLMTLACEWTNHIHQQDEQPA